MTVRPSDLPDYSNPPVTEVVVGVQFNSIDRFVTAHVGRLWERFKAEFPSAEEHPPVMPVFETFGQAPMLGGLGFAFPAILGMPRTFFVNANKTQVLQIQKDRFLHNWRKVGDADSYPRFERIVATFQRGVEQFVSFLGQEQLGGFEPNQCEITYINQIVVPSNDRSFTAMVRLFDGLVGHPHMDGLCEPEDARMLPRYVIPGAAGRPIGRLIVSAEPAKRLSGEDIIQLSLTARGTPETTDIDGVLAFLQTGRRHIVRGFTSLTATSLHTQWGLKE